MAALAAIPALALAPRAAASRLAPFRTLSARLTGFDIERIHPERARGMIEALIAAGDGPALDRLLAGREEDRDRPLAGRIVEAWYAGAEAGAGWPASRRFHEALVWQALDFMQPPGICSRTPGDWSRPPPREHR